MGIFGANTILGIIFGQDESNIGGIAVDASVTESHSSPCEITENPVEDGSTISDHAQIKPKELTIDGVITDTPLYFPIIQNIMGIVNKVQELFGKDSRSIDAYNKFISLQNTREPFTVITGLRKYDNMMLENFTVDRTAKSGGAIVFKAKMKQVVIAESKSGGTSMFSSSLSSLGGSTKDLGKTVSNAVDEVSPNSVASDLTETSALRKWGNRQLKIGEGINDALGVTQ
jgi:hypothetical protein